MGKTVYLSDEVLLTLEAALDGHADGASPDTLKEIEIAAVKIGAALDRPWALKATAGEPA